MSDRQPDQRRQESRRPVLRADLSRAIITSADDPAARREAAHTTARAVVTAGADPDVDLAGLLDLPERVGLDDLAALWRSAEPGTLPATLWTLYLLRVWCRRQGHDVLRLYRAGHRHAEVAAAIAGLPDAPDGGDVAALADALLRGFLRGDAATSLERAAAFCRVVAAGRGDEAAGTGAGSGTSTAELGLRTLATAADLDRAAEAVRAGTLR